MLGQSLGLGLLLNAYCHILDRWMYKLAERSEVFHLNSVGSGWIYKQRHLQSSALFLYHNTMSCNVPDRYHEAKFFFVFFFFPVSHRPCRAVEISLKKIVSLSSSVITCHALFVWWSVVNLQSIVSYHLSTLFSIYLENAFPLFRPLSQP